MFRLSIPASAEPLDPEKIEVKELGPWSVETWHITGVNGDRIPLNINVSETVKPKVALLGGHGLYGSKDAPYLKGAARRWTKDAVQTIIPDLPFHGDRTVDGMAPEQAMTPHAVQRAMGDFSRTVDFVKSRPQTAALPLAFVGFSMSTMLGVPFVAADDRIDASAFVVGGSQMETVFNNDPQMPEPIKEQLAALDPATYAGGTHGRPVLMMNAHQDEAFSRKSAMDLFDAFGSPKMLTFFEGTHVVWPHPKLVYDRLLAFFLELAVEDL
jgi:dienelactone hydrolase